MVEQLPTVKTVLKNSALERLLRHCAGHARLPICHIENFHDGSRDSATERGPQLFRAKANTLLIANTFGVHARGNAEPEISRLAL